MTGESTKAGHVGVGRVSLPQGPLVENLLRFQKIVQSRWPFDVARETWMRLRRRRGEKEEDTDGERQEGRQR